MEVGKKESQWERTNVTNLLRNRESGTYYARVKVNGKQKWRTLETSVFSVAKLRLPDKERELREHGQAERSEQRPSGAEEMQVGHFIAIFKQRTAQDVSIEPATRERRLTAIKAVVTTWPDLPGRDIRRVTAVDCRAWAARALRVGTGFIAPNVKTKREGMSASAFNKCVDALRAVFEIAREQGVIYKNHAEDITKAPVKKKRLDLPSPAQFLELAKRIASSGSKWRKSKSFGACRPLLDWSSRHELECFCAAPCGTLAPMCRCGFSRIPRGSARKPAAWTGSRGRASGA